MQGVLRQGVHILWATWCAEPRFNYFCFSPVSKAASHFICTGDRLRGDRKHRLPEVQLWEQLQQLPGLRGGLVPSLTRGQERGAQTGDHHPDLRLYRAGWL